MNAELVNIYGFANRDLLDQDTYQLRTQADVAFATQFSVTLVGTGSYTMRWRDVGKACQFECEFSSTTTIASTAGTSYFLLPLRSYNASNLAFGKGGLAQMNNLTTNVATGLCSIKLVNGRCYLPALVASGNTFQVAGWYPIG